MFKLVWRAANDMRLGEVVNTMLILKDAFQFPGVYTEQGPFPITEESFRLEWTRNATKNGLFTTLPAYRQDEPVGMGFQMVIGSPPDPPIFSDYLIFKVGDRRVSGLLDHIEGCVRVTTCAQAYLSDWRNENSLNFFDRDKAFRNPRKPGIIRWWHYLDDRMTKNLGGMDFCLKAPAWRVGEFHNGVLIQLTEEEFDVENPGHLEIQEEAMRYFGIWDFPIAK
jgi:hypothetical protein